MIQSQNASIVVYFPEILVLYLEKLMPKMCKESFFTLDLKNGIQYTQLSAKIIY